MLSPDQLNQVQETLNNKIGTHHWREEQLYEGDTTIYIQHNSRCCIRTGGRDQERGSSYLSICEEGVDVFCSEHPEDPVSSDFPDLSDLIVVCGFNAEASTGSDGQTAVSDGQTAVSDGEPVTSEDQTGNTGMSDADVDGLGAELSELELELKKPTPLFVADVPEQDGVEAPQEAPRQKDGKKKKKGKKGKKGKKKEEEVEDDPKNWTEERLLLEHMLDFAHQNGFKRLNGEVYKHVKGLFYERFGSVEDFINLAFSKKGTQAYVVFRKKVSAYFATMRNWCKYQHEPRFPILKTMKNLYVYENGVLDISGGRMVLRGFDEFADQPDAYSSVYFRGVNFDEAWKTATLDDLKQECPLFMKINEHHLEDPRVVNIFLGLLGRLHYWTRELDSFNCFLLIKGPGGSGKSVIFRTILALHQTYGSFSASFKQEFGFADIYQSGLVACNEFPSDVAKNMTRTKFIEMIEGAVMDIPRKHTSAVRAFNYQIPFFCVGNASPNFEDSHGAVLRRTAMFVFDKTIPERDNSLEKKIRQSELGQILPLVLRAYQELLVDPQLSNLDFDGWDCIPYLKKTRVMVALRSCQLYYFLLAPESDGNSVWYEEEEGSHLQVWGVRIDWLNFAVKHRVENPEKVWIETGIPTIQRAGFSLAEKDACDSCKNLIPCDCEEDFDVVKKLCVLNVKRCHRKKKAKKARWAGTDE